MKLITEKMLKAFNENKNINLGNTQVIASEHKTVILLFGNLIAERNIEGLFIQNLGWLTNTTKERLNALPNISIKQKKGVWYLNGKEWDGERFLIVN